ncbi:MAG: hypothetical protein AB8B93_01245 [Pseudomonadales bacterium]
MADILPFKPERGKKLKKQRQQDKAKHITLCKRGFHKWDIDQAKQFDVKQGRLVTVHRCIHCGATKTTAR